MSSSKKRLVVFCLEWNQKSSLVSHSYYWIREFRNYFDEIDVYAVHKGEYEEIDGVDVHELGGGSTKGRLTAVRVLILALCKILLRREQFKVFHHMITEPLAIIGAPLRLMGVRQVLWYSHSSFSFSLRLGFPFVDAVVTPTKECFPVFPSPKVFEVGHGIEIERFVVNKTIKRKKRCVVIGRISRIKHLENLLKTLARVKEIYGISIPVDFIGPILDRPYLRDLETIAKTMGIEVNFIPAVKREEVAKILNQYEYAYNGNPSTVDKSALESSIMGCFVISDILPVQKLSGMAIIWQELDVQSEDLDSQILSLEKISERKRIQFRTIIIEQTRNLNDLSLTIKKLNDVMVKE